MSRAQCSESQDPFSWSAAGDTDDFSLDKPVHVPELVARVAAVLRRRQGPREGPRWVGDLVIDPATRSVKIGGRPVGLANKEFALLRALAADPTRVFTKEEPGALHRGVPGGST